LRDAHAPLPLERKSTSRARADDPSSFRPVSAVFFLDRFELGLGRITFLDDPVERVEEVADARPRRLGTPLTHDVVDLARCLAPEQLFGCFLVQANHPVASPR